MRTVTQNREREEELAAQEENNNDYGYPRTPSITSKRKTKIKDTSDEHIGMK
jgi:hypothetical protein